MNKSTGMKFYSIGIAIFIYCVTFSLSGFAQLNQGGIPYSTFYQIDQPAEADLILTSPDMEMVAAEDALHPIPYRFAINLPVNTWLVDPGSGNIVIASGAKQRDLASGINLPGSERMWVYSIHAPGAKAMTLYFDQFYIPEGGKLFLYNADKSTVIGAFTAMNNNQEKLFSTELIPGDWIILEYNQPAGDSKMPKLHISEIAYAYRGIPENSESTGFGSSGPCEVNVKCSEGAQWQEEQKGIMRIGVKKFGATYWCSGSLVNNTRQDNTPYVLTADHCGQGATPQDISEWIFYFNFESAGCPNPPDAPSARAMTGATTISAGGDVNIRGSDFLLLLLDQYIPDTFDVWFNGWNRLDIPSQYGVGIHHPRGDIKKISTYTTPLVDTTWNQHPEKSHWQVTWSETLNGHGVTEGGSSGSPLFDPSGRIVGALTGGEALCDSFALNLPDYYGKFSWSWDMNGPDATQRLDYWLDPDQTGVEVLDGIPLGIPEVVKLNPDLQIYPNPVSSIIHLTSRLFEPGNTITATIFDAWGRQVLTLATNFNDSKEIQVDLTSIPNGFYIIQLQLEGQILTGRIIKQ